MTLQNLPEPPASASPGDPPGKELTANGDGTVRKRRRRRRGRRGSRDNNPAILPNGQDALVTADASDDSDAQVARAGEYEASINPPFP